MNEPYSYVDRKNRIYTITLVSRKKDKYYRYDKSSERIQRLLHKSPKAEHYYSDAYSEVCYYKNSKVTKKTKVRLTL